MKKYEKDKIVEGNVTGIEPYGIFIDLGDDYEGLIHISEISSDFVRNVSDYARIGETLKVRVIDVNEKKHHVRLSIKNLNYRCGNNMSIEETEHGFETLKKNLEVWKNDKINEIENK